MHWINIFSAVAAKAPRKALGGSNSGGASSSVMSPKSGKTSKYAGGNAVCERPTPEWQKGIATFLSPAKQKENQEPMTETMDMADDGPSSAAGSR